MSRAEIAAMFKDEATRRMVFAPMMASTDADKSMRDTAACLDYPAAQPQVLGDKVGVPGWRRRSRPRCWSPEPTRTPASRPSRPCG